MIEISSIALNTEQRSFTKLHPWVHSDVLNDNADFVTHSCKLYSRHASKNFSGNSVEVFPSTMDRSLMTFACLNFQFCSVSLGAWNGTKMDSKSLSRWLKFE